MTVSDAAKMLGVTGARVRQFISSGDLKAERIGAFMWNVNIVSVHALAARRDKKRLAREAKKGEKQC